MDEKVEIYEYNPMWAIKFTQESQLIEDLFGDWVQGIHHVGSTSVIGLAAKPIIDICITSPIYPPTLEVISKMASLCYQHMGEDSVDGRHWFKKGVPRSHHVHWCPIGGKVVASQLSFRDKLRSNPKLAKEYECVKKELAGKYGLDRIEYVKAKEPIILKILKGD